MLPYHSGCMTLRPTPYGCNPIKSVQFGAILQPTHHHAVPGATLILYRNRVFVCPCCYHREWLLISNTIWRLGEQSTYLWSPVVPWWPKAEFPRSAGAWYGTGSSCSHPRGQPHGCAALRTGGPCTCRLQRRSEGSRFVLFKVVLLFSGDRKEENKEEQLVNEFLRNETFRISINLKLYQRVDVTTIALKGNCR